MTVPQLFPSIHFTHKVFSVLFVLIMFSSVNAQDTVTGAFEGIVSDSQSGARLRGAAVSIVNDQTGISFTLRTDYRGRFFQGLLLPGTYTISVSLPGYQTQTIRQRLRITYTGEVVPVPVALEPSGSTPAAT